MMASLALFSMLLGSPAAQARVILVFGVEATEAPSAMAARMRPGLEALAREAGAALGEEVEIRLDAFTTPLERRAGLVSGRFDFVRLGPASYVLAKSEKPGLQLLATERTKGRKTTKGVICVRTDSDIADLGQLRGGTFAFGGRRSTFGHFFPQQALADAGIKARSLARFEYLGRHDTVGRAVASGKFDAGAMSERSFKALLETGVSLRAIAKYTVPTDPWVARAGMSPRIRQALTEALLRLEDPKVLKALGADGFMEASDDDFGAVREAIQVNPRFLGGIG